MTSDAHGNFSGGRLVIFGCGYVGAAVARAATARGIAVTALTRNSGTAGALRQAGIEVVEAELSTSFWHDRIDGRVDYVLNAVSAASPDLAGYQRSYVDGMKSILTWAAAIGGVGTFVYTSSTSVYPQGGGTIVDERAATSDASERPALLREAERLLASSVVCQRWFVLRLAGIYGPGRHHLLDQVRSGAVAGTGDVRLNLAHRDDVARAVAACFAAPAAVRNEIFNVADDAPTRKAEVVSWLSEKLGCGLPGFSGSPAGARRALTPDRIVSNAKVKSLLGWRPLYPTFREGYDALLAERA